MCAPTEAHHEEGTRKGQGSRVALRRHGVQAVHSGYICCTFEKERTVAKDHGPSVKNDKQYEGLREKGYRQVPGSSDLQLARRLQQRR